MRQAVRAVALDRRGADIGEGRPKARGQFLVTLARASAPTGILLRHRLKLPILIVAADAGTRSTRDLGFAKSSYDLKPGCKKIERCPSI
jgi:hypothetical protein